MTEKPNPDDLIRAALQAEGAGGFEPSAEPGLTGMLTEIFRGRMWWTSVFMMANLVVCMVCAVLCGWQFFMAAELPAMLRWGAGFFFFLVLTIGCKLWYWMRIERLAMTREIKRVELLIAHLAAERQHRS